MPRNSIKTQSGSSDCPMRTALTPEARESQAVSLAEQLALQRLKDGTASDTLVIAYLKRGSRREDLELRQLESDVKLKEAKTQQIQSSANAEEVIKAGFEAILHYGGRDNGSINSDEEDL